jgi:hypothetical protein
MAARTKNPEAVTRLAGVAVKRDQRCEASRIDALDRAEVEAHGLFANQRIQFLQELLLLTSNELAGAAEDVFGWTELGVVHGCLLTRLAASCNGSPRQACWPGYFLLLAFQHARYGPKLECSAVEEYAESAKRLIALATGPRGNQCAIFVPRVRK